MHSKEDDEPKFDLAGRAGELVLKPENSDDGIEQWREEFLTDNNPGYDIGVKAGWAKAIECLRILDGGEPWAAKLEKAYERAREQNA